MISTIKNEQGHVICYCEWRVVGQSGYDMDNGEYVWVNDMWVHEDYRGDNLINRIIDDVISKIPDSVQYCYFQRKNTNDKVRMYSRSTWERRRDAYESLNVRRN